VKKGITNGHAAFLEKRLLKATKQQQHSGPIEMAFILLLTTSHKTF
jgi:hypothetical protein